MIRRLGYYIRGALKFYDIKADGVAPAVFVALLFVGFMDYVMPWEITNKALPYILYNLISAMVIYFISTVYIYAFISDLRKREYGFAGLRSFIRRMGVRVVIISLMISLFTIPVTLISAYLLPGSEMGMPSELGGFVEYMLLFAFLLLAYTVLLLILYLRYLLALCYMADKNFGIAGALKASARATQGHRAEIFGIVVVFNLIIYFAITFVTSFALLFNNALMFSFVSCFAATILGLVQQRLLTLVYMDLEYGYGKPGKREI